MNALILLLAGQSQRLNLSTKKQFILLDGKPLFIHALNCFIKSNKFDKYCLVISKEDENVVKNFVTNNCCFNNNNISYVVGGSTRQESVFNGLTSLKNTLKDNDKVLIHDAARIHVTNSMIEEILNELDKNVAVVPTTDVVDSIVVTNNSLIDKYVNRDQYKLIQTPQGFKYKDILDAHIAFKNDIVTDDASLILKSGKTVKLIKGDRLNFKVTTAEDLELIKYVLEARK